MVGVVVGSVWSSIQSNTLFSASCVQEDRLLTFNVIYWFFEKFNMLSEVGCFTKFLL